MSKTLNEDAAKILLAFIFCMIATAAFAQNADFDSGMQGWSAIMWGPGAKVAVMAICGYLGFWGFSHQHLWVSFCALLGAISYYAVGTVLGRMGIV